MGTAAPFSARLVEYTVKDVDRPAEGTVTIDGTTYDVPSGSSWAVLDHARGRGRYRTDWNWGAAAGESGGRRIGLQLGGGGKDAVRQGISQNAVSVDGRVHKLSGALAWSFDPSDWSAPWRVTGARLDVVFTPFHTRLARTNLLVIRSTTAQCFGTYRGRLRMDDGEWIEFDGLVGWAEDVHNRW
jgi:hypothetical protein